MATLQIRSLDENLYRALRDAARRDRRSLAQQATAMLAAALLHGCGVRGPGCGTAVLNAPGPPARRCRRSVRPAGESPQPPQHDSPAQPATLAGQPASGSRAGQFRHQKRALADEMQLSNKRSSPAGSARVSESHQANLIGS